MCKILIILPYCGVSPLPDCPLLAGLLLIIHSSKALLPQSVSLALGFFFCPLAQSGALIPAQSPFLTEQNTALFPRGRITPSVPPSKWRGRETNPSAVIRSALWKDARTTASILLHYLWVLHYYKHCMISLTGILQCAVEDGVNEEFLSPFLLVEWSEIILKTSH